MTPPVDESEGRTDAEDADGTVDVRPPRAGTGPGESLSSNVAQLTVDALDRAGKRPERSRILLLGLGGADGEHARVRGLVDRLTERGVTVAGFDRDAPAADLRDLFDDAEVLEDLDASGFDGVVVVTPDPAVEDDALDDLADALNDDGVVVDTTGAVDPAVATESGLVAITYWGV